MNHPKIMPRSFISSARNRLPKRKGAAALLCSIAAAFVLLALSGTSISAALRVRQERRTERDLIQADYLCEAGLYRAIAQLRSNPEYKGEEWLDAQASPDLSNFSIGITVLPISDTTADSTSPASTNRFRITITATIKDRQYIPTSLQRTLTDEIAITKK